MGEHREVVYLKGTPTKAPEFIVAYICRRCGEQTEVSPYFGVPVHKGCEGPGTEFFMTPVRIVKPELPKPADMMPQSMKDHREKMAKNRPMQ